MEHIHLPWRPELQTNISFLSKTLERAISNQLSYYLSQIILLDPHPSGFKSAHSIETALLVMTESLRAARASALASVLILLNLSVAFHPATLAELGMLNLRHLGSHSTWRIAPIRSHGMAPCSNHALSTLVSLKALSWGHFCSPYVLDQSFSNYAYKRCKRIQIYIYILVQMEMPPVWPMHSFIGPQASIILYFVILLLFYNIGHNGGTWGDKYFLRWYAV